MQLHRLLSRPGHAWTFRCRREGCSEHDRRFKYSELVEHCRLHLLARQQQILESMLSAITPPAVNAELDRRIRDVETQVTELRGIVAKRPSAGLQRELQAAETELADLQLAAAAPATPSVPPDELLKIMVPIIAGNYDVRTLPDGRTSFEVPLPIDSTTPEQAIQALLTPKGFDYHLPTVVPLLIHSLKVKASAGLVEVVDLLDAPLAPIELSFAQQIGRALLEGPL
jgi:hypothetical protein